MESVVFGRQRATGHGSLHGGVGVGLAAGLRLRFERGVFGLEGFVLQHGGGELDFRLLGAEGSGEGGVVLVLGGLRFQGVEFRLQLRVLGLERSQFLWCHIAVVLVCCDGMRSICVFRPEGQNVGKGRGVHEAAHVREGVLAGGDLRRVGADVVHMEHRRELAVFLPLDRRAAALAPLAPAVEPWRGAVLPVEGRRPERRRAVLVVEIEIRALPLRLQRCPLGFEFLRAGGRHQHVDLHGLPALARRDRVRPGWHEHHFPARGQRGIKSGVAEEFVHRLTSGRCGRRLQLPVGSVSKGTPAP